MYLEIQWQMDVDQQQSEGGIHWFKPFMVDIGADRRVNLVREGKYWGCKDHRDVLQRNYSLF